MLRYYNFLMSILARKKSFLIIFILFCALFSFIFFAKLREPDQTAQRLFPIDTFTSWFPFVFGTIFTLFGAVRIFKTGERDGTELLISSKPIVRQKIIIAKFLATWSLIFIFNILSFIFYLSIAQADSFATNNERLMFALSMTLGSFIVSTIMGAIVILLSSILGINGVISTGILFASAIPIISFTIVPVSNAISPLEAGTGSMQGTYLASKDFPRDSKVSEGSSSSNDRVPTQDKNMFVLDKESKSWRAKEFRKARNTWFKRAKFADVWYQWGRFYSLTKPGSVKNEQKSESEFGYRTKQIDFDYASDNEIDSFLKEAKRSSISTYEPAVNITQRVIKEWQRWVMLFQKDELEFWKNTLLPIINKQRYYQLTRANGSLPAKLREASRNFLSLASAEAAKTKQASEPLDKVKAGDKILATQLANTMKKLFNLNRDIPTKYYRILLWMAVNRYQRQNLQRLQSSVGTPSERQVLYEMNGLYQNDLFRTLFRQQIYSQQVPFNIRNSEADRDYSLPELREKYMFASNFKESDYLETNGIVIVWSVIGVSILLISTVVYFRRDFR